MFMMYRRTTSPREFPIILDGDYNPIVKINLWDYCEDFLWRKRDIFDRWQAQPRDEDEMNECMEDHKFLDEINPFLEQHCEAMKREQEYLKAYLDTVDWDDLMNFSRGARHYRNCRLKRTWTDLDTETVEANEKRCRHRFHTQVSFKFFQ